MLQRKIIEGPSSSVISIVPFPIQEDKPGLYPGSFHIDPCTNEDCPQILIVKDSHYFQEIDESRSLRITVPSYEVVQSIVNDYTSSQVGVDAENIDERCPGIFWIDHVVTVVEVLSKYSEQLKEASRKQKNWFVEMVKVGDDVWEATRRHIDVPNTARVAAKILGLDRPWLINIPLVLAQSTLKCPACASILQPTAIVCSACRCIINPVEYKKLQFSEVS